MNELNTPAQILTAIAQIPQLERGKLTAYHFKERPGKTGPYYKLQYHHHGKNHTHHIRPEEVPAVEQALDGYRQFQALIEQYLDLRVAQTRAERAAQSKKKVLPPNLLACEPALQQILSAFVAQPPTGRTTRQLELDLRAAAFQLLGPIVAAALQAAIDRVEADYQPKKFEQWKGWAALEVRSLFGTHRLLRAYYYNPKTRQGHHPADAALGLQGSYTPALAQLTCWAGAESESFEMAEAQLRVLGALQVPARQIHRLVQRVGAAAVVWQNQDHRPGDGGRVKVLYVSVDGTGVPMRRLELQGRQGRQPDGTAKTRQSYLACVFTQQGCDAQGRPLRDYQSTTYLAGFDTIEEFGLKVRREALRRGSGTAQKIVLLIDGACGLENLGRIYFPDHLQIVDFYHALEHAGRVLQALWGPGHPDYRQQLRQWSERLLQDGVEALIAEARRLAAKAQRTQAVEKELGYFQRNTARMQYGTFRQQGLFIGSGVIEAGCKHIVGARCKQSGMRWSLPGAERILTLRCLQRSRRLDDFWNDQVQTPALPKPSSLAKN